MRLAPLALALGLATAASAQSSPMAAGTDHEKPPVPPSHSLNVTFQGRLRTFRVEDLLALPQVTVHVHNAQRNTDETYSGPLLSDVLAKAGLVASKETEPLILHSSVIATGTDHYFVLYSAAEVEPMFSRSQVIVAVMKSGLPDAEGGNIQLINTDGAKPARWVHGLADINVMSVSPTVH
ncbi:MAG TPA: hypothetical protein VMD97_08100 [Candidatus Aquilonibacter sp.]|nr:hypothetical protein [Candidatus Aquilonibacter sp.]